MCGTLLQSFPLVKTLVRYKMADQAPNLVSGGRSPPDRSKDPPDTPPSSDTRSGSAPPSPDRGLPAMAIRAVIVAHLTEHCIVPNIAPAQIAA